MTSTQIIEIPNRFTRLPSENPESEFSVHLPGIKGFGLTQDCAQNDITVSRRAQQVFLNETFGLNRCGIYDLKVVSPHELAPDGDLKNIIEAVNGHRHYARPPIEVITGLRKAKNDEQIKELGYEALLPLHLPIVNHYSGANLYDFRTRKLTAKPSGLGKPCLLAVHADKRGTLSEGEYDIQAHVYLHWLRFKPFPRTVGIVLLLQASSGLSAVE